MASGTLDPRSLENRRMLVRLAIAAVGMFGFGFALVPFYEKICEVTGLRNLLVSNASDNAENTQVDTTRNIVVEMDANTHSLAWRFKPLQSNVTVHPGQLVRVDYEIENTLDRAVTGQAIPSYGPKVAERHFRKLECFCFTQQTLGPKEKRIMPVVFVIDGTAPVDMNEITLSYTFFEVAGKG